MDLFKNYRKDFSLEIQEKLIELEEIFDSVLPDCQKKMAYGVCAYFKGKNIIFFGANKNGVSIYPHADGMEHFKENIQKYKTSKGTFQIPVNQKLPASLLKEIAKHNYDLYAK